MPSSSRATLPGSNRQPVADAQAAHAVPDNERFEVTVRVRRRADLAAQAAADTGLPAQRQYLSHAEYEAQYGASQQDVDAVIQFATQYGLVVVGQSLARRSVFLSGTAAQFCAAFDTELKEYQHAGGTYRGREGELSVHTDVHALIEGVFGLDNRPVAKPHFQYRRAAAAVGIAPHLADTSVTPPQLAKLYDFPTGVDGSGQTIALIELGGGYRPADLQTYFSGLGLPAPKVKTVRVDGGNNAPSTPDGADGEVMLDIEVAAAVAPAANIVVYFAPNTDKGFLDAITQAIHDTTNNPSVISISWGGAESSWTPQSMTSYDQAFQSAATLGITVACAAGDNGSADGATDGQQHADFPASSPSVLACGGTKISFKGDSITQEVVWDEGSNSATGGGVSAFFAQPAYQSGLDIKSANSGNKSGRGLPDVSGDADPQSGYAIRVDGQNMVIGGTSAVAPLWAGLVALLNQKLGARVGFLNPVLYGKTEVQATFRDITQGNNGAYSAKAGWDPCTGWGSPDGNKLLAALAAKPA